MCSLKPPRHISTLPITKDRMMLRRRQLVRCEQTSIDGARSGWDHRLGAGLADLGFPFNENTRPKARCNS